jgi:hypothetical protein
MRHQRALTAGADDRVSFPIPITAPLADDSRPLVDLDGSRDFSSPITPPPPFSPKTKEAFPVCPIMLLADPPIDGLVRHLTTAGPPMLTPQPATDLIGRPVVLQSAADLTMQLGSI